MEIIEDQYAKKSYIITSRLPVSAGYEIKGNQMLSETILDRTVLDRTKGRISEKKTNHQSRNQKL